MKTVTETDINIIADSLRAGGLVVLRTDTIYGLVARADDETACEQVFELKRRQRDKACIVLVADEGQVWDDLSCRALAEAERNLQDETPSSLIVPVGENTPAWIHRGGSDVAFRVPRNRPWLLDLLRLSGPLIAPSANLEGSEPAQTPRQAYEYFGDGVSLYVDGGEVSDNTPSHLYRYCQGQFERLR